VRDLSGHVKSNEFPLPEGERVSLPAGRGEGEGKRTPPHLNLLPLKGEKKKICFLSMFGF